MKNQTLFDVAKTNKKGSALAKTEYNNMLKMIEIDLIEQENPFSLNLKPDINFQNLILKVVYQL